MVGLLFGVRRRPCWTAVDLDLHWLPEADPSAEAFCGRLRLHGPPIGKPRPARDEGVPLRIWNGDEVFRRLHGESACLEHLFDSREVRVFGHERR